MQYNSSTTIAIEGADRPIAAVEDTVADETQAIKSYVRSIQKDVANGIATEHTYRPALKALLEASGSRIAATNEPKRIECGAPDFTVSRQIEHGLLTLGYVEAKDIGTDLAAIERNSERVNPTTREGQQVKRYRAALANLILTDYLEFRWYVRGERRSVARLASVDARRRLVVDGDGGSAVLGALSDFLAQRPEAISRPSDLAERMARLTHLIRNVVGTAFENGVASPTLRGLRDAFAEVLIPNLSESDFADMFAQTLSYGLFAARVAHDPSGGLFRRQDAAHEIPRTNPFLRNLFDHIAGARLDDEPFVGLVDDLAQLLAHTEMPAVLSDFGKRQARTDPVMHFYETFLAAYDPALREMRGVYYTPEPVVSYIVRSVDELLRTRFECPDGLADTSTITYPLTGEDGNAHSVQAPKVLVLDPACGTGTFLYAVIDLIRDEFIRGGNAGKWSGYVQDGLLPRLFGFELLMAPYAMAHLKLGMQLAAKDIPEEHRSDWAYDFATGERLSIFLTNTLEEAIKRSQMLMGQFISEEANAAANIKKDKRIMVVLGNPPYSGHSANKGPWIRKLVRDYYHVDGQPLAERNSKWLQDDYVKFIRFGQWRIQETGQGVLAFVTNHGYLDNPTFRGMRQQLMNAFTDIYILDLHGNSKKSEVTPDGSKDENVFDIQQGVAIAVFVREPGETPPATVHHANLWGVREGKYDDLARNTVASIDWTTLQPNSPSYLFAPQDVELLPEYDSCWPVTKMFLVYASTVTTARNDFAMAYDRSTLNERVGDLRNRSVDDRSLREKYRLKDVSYWNLKTARERLQNIQEVDSFVRTYCYRPFDFRFVFYHEAICERLRSQVMRHMEIKNVALLTHRPQSPGDFTFAYCTNMIGDQCVAANKTAGGGNSFQFPLYLNDTPTDTNGTLFPKTEVAGATNLAPDFIQALSGELGLAFVPDATGDLEKTFGPEDVFHFVYAVLHSPAYRKRYAEFLRTDFPRVPLTGSVELFKALIGSGAELVALHLLESPGLRAGITRYPVPGDHLVEPGHPRYLPPGEPEPGTGKPLQEGRIYISKDDRRSGKRGQYIEGVPPDVWEFQVGGYQVCEKWLKDRRGRTLTSADLGHYERIVVALKETIRLMAEIDEAIEAHGGWPLR